MRTQYEKFLFFGDSITEFSYNSRMQPEKGDQFTIGAALTAAYSRKLDVLTRGYSGYSSRWALKLLPKILESESNISIATIFFGSNDLCEGGHQSVPLEEFNENTLTLVNMMKTKGIRPIIVGPALFDETKWNNLKAEEVAKGYRRTSEGFKTFSDAAKALAAREDVGFVNLNDAFTREGGANWSDLLTDGLHFTGKGYEVFFNELLKVIREKHPEYAPENLTIKPLLWSEVKADGSNL